MQSGDEIVYVALGSNLGDRAGIFTSVIREIEADDDLQLWAVSPVYETDPIGPGDQGAYLNSVLCLRTRRTPSDLLARMQDIELAHGRDRSQATERWGPRTLDLDILFYGGARHATADLIIPHPRAHERAFVMVPMVELAPAMTHPTLGRTMSTLLASLRDVDTVRRVSAPSGWPEPTRA